VDIQIRGDPQGVRACAEMNKSQKEDLADVIGAAGSFGRAFFREKARNVYRIWEISAAGEAEEISEARRGSMKFEISLFAEGHIPLAPEDNGQE
jgi:hypothetical protein